VPGEGGDLQVHNRGLGRRNTSRLGRRLARTSWDEWRSLEMMPGGGRGFLEVMWQKVWSRGA